jgi:hypothetical protein
VRLSPIAFQIKLLLHSNCISCSTLIQNVHKVLFLYYNQTRHSLLQIIRNSKMYVYFNPPGPWKHSWPWSHEANSPVQLYFVALRIGSIVTRKGLQCHAQMCFKHNASCTPTGSNTRACCRGSMGSRRLVLHDQRICSLGGTRPRWKTLNGCSFFFQPGDQLQLHGRLTLLWGRV